MNGRTPADERLYEGHRLDGSPMRQGDAFAPVEDERTVEQIAEQDAHEHIAQFCADIEDGQADADGYSEAA